jgi:CTP:molybdopterin cytidylyltransferase MocA
LLAVTEEREGLREVVSRHREELLSVTTDTPLTLTNLNTQDDYEAALKLLD